MRIGQHLLLAAGLFAAACGPSQPQQPGQAPRRAIRLSKTSLERTSRTCTNGSRPRRRSWASTRYDDRLEDYSRQALEHAVASARRFRDSVGGIDASTLSAANQLDREQLLRAIDSQLLTLEVIRPWARDPDSYSSGLTNTAYIMIKREFAPPEERLRRLIAREKAMPAALAEARTNLEDPPGSTPRSPWSRSTATGRSSRRRSHRRFRVSRTRRCSTEFRGANDAVVAALGEYKTWLQTDLLNRSNGQFAIGEESFRRKLAADEMVDLRSIGCSASPKAICGRTRPRSRRRRSASIQADADEGARGARGGSSAGG